MRVISNQHLQCIIGCKRTCVTICTTTLLATYCKAIVSLSALLTWLIQAPFASVPSVPARKERFFLMAKLVIAQSFMMWGYTHFYDLRKHLWDIHPTEDRNWSVSNVSLAMYFKDNLLHHCTLLKRKKIPTTAFHPFSHLCLEDTWQNNFTVLWQNSSLYTNNESYV